MYIYIYIDIYTDYEIKLRKVQLNIISTILMVSFQIELDKL